jgi:hypothetical protein
VVRREANRRIEMTEETTPSPSETNFTLQKKKMLLALQKKRERSLSPDDIQTIVQAVARRRQTHIWDDDPNDPITAFDDDPTDPIHHFP